MLSIWISFTIFLSISQKNGVLSTELNAIAELGGHYRKFDYHNEKISKLLGEVENAYLQKICGQLLLTSENIEIWEQSLFSVEHSIAKLLVGTLEETEMIPTSKHFAEFLSKEFLHSQNGVSYVIMFVESPQKNSNSTVQIKVFKNSSKIFQANATEDEKSLEFLKKNLMDQCDDKKMHNKSFTDVLWTKPYSNCIDEVVVRAFYVAYTCNRSNRVNVRSYLEQAMSLKKVNINQCDVRAEESNPFAGTNICPEDSICSPIENYGLRDGGYTCTCQNNHRFNGSTLLDMRKSYIRTCKSCAQETFCSDLFVLPDAVTVAGLSSHIIIMIVMFLPGLLVAKLRKTKTLSFNFWQLYEVMLCGGLLIYLSVIVDYMDVTAVTCIVGRWLREIGFVILYSSMMLKIHRMRVESRSRQAQRVLLRDKDLIRYLAVILLLVTWQLLSWTVINVERLMDHGRKRLQKGGGSEPTKILCEIGAWHYVIEIEEFVVLVCFVYLCCSVGPPPSFAAECRAITFSLANEAVLSALHNIVKHFVKSSLTHRGNFLMSVVRCHLTVSVNLILLMGIKLWQARTSSHVTSSCRRKEGSKMNAKEGMKASSDHRPLKAQTSTSKKSQDNKDSNDMSLSGLNPEDVKAELRRLYKQLDIYKAKSSRKDLCHNIKKQATRKQGPRRFSLYNFHHSRHSKHHSTLTDKTRCPEEATERDHSRITPEESTNSCEVWNLMSTLP